MRRRAAIFLCVLAGALGTIWLPISAQGPVALGVERIGGSDARAREALVRFRRAPRATDLDRLAGEVDADAIARVGRTGIYRLRSRNLDAATFIARSRARRRRIRGAQLPVSIAARRTIRALPACGASRNRPAGRRSPASPAPTSMRRPRGLSPWARRTSSSRDRHGRRLHPPRSPPISGRRQRRSRSTSAARR